MLKFFKRVGGTVSQFVKSIGKGSLAVALAVTLCGAMVADVSAADIVTYNNADGGGLVWDFSSVLEMMFAALGAAIAAGVIVWVAIKGYQLMKRFLSGR